MEVRPLGIIHCGVLVGAPLHTTRCVRSHRVSAKCQVWMTFFVGANIRKEKKLAKFVYNSVERFVSSETVLKGKCLWQGNVR